MKIILLILLSLATPLAFAVEGGTSLYLPGFFSPQAGIIPDSGNFVGLDFYSYAGSASKSTKAERIYLDTDIERNFSIASFTHVFETKVNGGKPFISFYLPYVDTSQNGKIAGGSFDKSTGGVGDVSLTGGLGWDNGNFHYAFRGNIYAPTGYYNEDKLLNVGQHRWGAQPMVAFTYLHPETGFEVSSVVGYTVNFKNIDTHYKSGDELNLELALLSHYKDVIYFGLVGYGYQQVTADSGDGTILGDFKGRVFAGGFAVGGSAPLTDVNNLTWNIRYYNEFNAIHRFEGDAFYVSGALNF